jgi:endonuclease YncB( thermonuclease family)
MAKVWILLVMFLAAGCTMTVNGTPVDGSTGGGGTTTSPGGSSGTVTNVVDGDTIDVNINGTVYRVRYIGMNTPESDEVCYQEATAANAALVEGKTVTLVKDTSETDRFDRLLRYVYVGDVFVNARLVQDGYAEVVSYPPDTAQFENFKSLEIAATSAGLGCHPTGIFNDGRFDR